MDSVPVTGSGFRVQRSWFVRGSRFVAAAIVVAALVPARAQEFAARTGAPVTFLQINDVYSTVPINGVGGLARVATLKKSLAEAGRTPFLVLAGDFLSPSVASSVFKGEQMIATLNAAGLDMATLGNHEFDFGDDELIKRMHEATFQWVVSNVVDTNTGKPIGDAAPFVVKTFGTVKVGFIGLCLTTSEISPDHLKHTRLIDPLTAAGQYLPLMKQAGATMFVAVTHLAMATDRALVETFPELDLIIGGHEHYQITAAEGRSLISKAGSDAKTVARIDMSQRPGGSVERFYEFLPITSAIPDDEKTTAVIAAYEARLGTALDIVVGASRVDLDAVSAHQQVSETNLGDMVADAIRADARTDIAMTNSGAIRGNRVYPAGQLTRRTLIEMHPFSEVICTLRLSGRVVLEALNHGVRNLPTPAGAFPQVSGLRMVVDRNAAPGSRVSGVRVNGQPLDLNRIYTVAIPDYILREGDGYTMFKGQPMPVGPEAGDLISDALEKYVAAAREVAPAIDGRITIR